MGQLPRSRMLHFADDLPFSEMRFSYNLAKIENRRGGDACCVEDGHYFLFRMRAHPLGSNLLDKCFVFFPCGDGRSTGIVDQLFLANNPAQACPLFVMRYGEHHVSVFTEETVARRGRRVTIAVTLPH